MDTITEDVMREVAASMVNEVPDEATVHTVKIELNGRHGGVDVTAEMTLPWCDDYEKTWGVY